MSQTPHSHDIRCDGTGCTARAHLPVGLRTALPYDRPGTGSSTLGWLFVKEGPDWKHYCPACASTIVLALSAGHAAENMLPTILRPIQDEGNTGSG